MKYGKFEMKKIIFCIGTGRCGSASLSFLLNSQESALVTHELFPILPWLEESKMTPHAAELLQYRIFQMSHQLHNYDIVGDSGSYYLPYLKYIIKTFQGNTQYDLKILVLKRDKNKTVDSFKTKFSIQNNNPLQNHSGLKNEWDNSFPKYNDVWTLTESIEKYYDDYYKLAEKLSAQHPEIIKIFDTETLNSEKKLKILFNHLGINDPRFIKNIRKNSG
jgi:hypothetical protein